MAREQLTLNADHRRSGYSAPSELKATTCRKQPLPPTASAARPAVAHPALEEMHIDDLLRLVVEKGGSDLHLCVGVPPIIRIDGQLTPAPFDRVTPQESQRMVYDILTDEQIQRFESTWSWTSPTRSPRSRRFRVNVFRDKGDASPPLSA